MRPAPLEESWEGGKLFAHSEIISWTGTGGRYGNPERAKQQAWRQTLREFRTEISDDQHFTSCDACLHACHGTGGWVLSSGFRGQTPERTWVDHTKIVWGVCTAQLRESMEEPGLATEAKRCFLRGLLTLWDHRQQDTTFMSAVIGWEELQVQLTTPEVLMLATASACLSATEARQVVAVVSEPRNGCNGCWITGQAVSRNKSLPTPSWSLCNLALPSDLNDQLTPRRVLDHTCMHQFPTGLCHHRNSLHIGIVSAIYFPLP